MKKIRNEWLMTVLAGTFAFAGCSSNDHGDDPPPQPMNTAPVIASLANLERIDLGAAVARYAETCPRCGVAPCRCPFP